MRDSKTRGSGCVICFEDPIMYAHDVCTTPVSRSYVYKKLTKPLLERRRRARMSRCLEELKTLMIAHLELKAESINRLEKADILEMTVEHLQKLSSRRSNTNLFQEGFHECAVEACHYLETVPGMNSEVSERLAEHLETCTGPLSIQLPEYKLCFSPPVSPATTPNSTFKDTPTSYHLETFPGLLMRVDVKGSPVFSPKNVEHNSSSDVGWDWKNSSSSNRQVSPTTESWAKETLEMWRPW